MVDKIILPIAWPSAKRTYGSPSNIIRKDDVKISLFGKVLTLLILLLVAADLGLGPQAARKRRKPKGPKPYRLGIHHPHPALCPGEEPSQRDLRVLRLAFDVGRYPRQWRNLPWFYVSRKTAGRKPAGKNAMPNNPLEIVLNTRRLWGQSVAPENGTRPKAGSFISPALLQSWRNRSEALLNGKARTLAPKSGRALLAASIPFLATRMIQSRNLPYLTETALDPTAEPANAVNPPQKRPTCHI